MTRPAPALRFRRPVETDHAPIVRLVDEWWGGRHLRQLLPRLWFQHFTGSSWIAETEDGKLAGFLVGFVSPDHPDQAYIHMVATNPNLRRRRIGAALYERFFEDARARGAHRVTAITWPGNRASVEFHQALGFRAVDDPGAQNIYGMRAFPDYEYDGEDRCVFVRELDVPT